jgi:hypothetical protein
MGHFVDIVKNKLAEILAKNRFPHTKIPEAVETVWLGIELYREYKTQRYYRHDWTVLKKPTRNHVTKIGRYDQAAARTILISYLRLAWLVAFEKPPRVNNKYGHITPFVSFATDILRHEGIGKIPQHLEKHMSIRKRCRTVPRKSEFPGG